MAKYVRIVSVLLFCTFITTNMIAQTLQPGSQVIDSKGTYRFLPQTGTGEQRMTFRDGGSLSFDPSAMSTAKVTSSALTAARAFSRTTQGSSSSTGFAISMKRRGYSPDVYPTSTSCAPFSAKGAVYDFGPEGLEFSSPATLTLPYSTDSEDSCVNVYYYNPSRKTWEIIQTLSRDTVNKTITVEITHFSSYVAGVESLRMDEGGSLDGGNHLGVSVDPYFGTLNIATKEFSIPTRGIPLELTARFNSDYLYTKYISTYTGSENTAGRCLVQAPHLEYAPPQTTTASGWSYELPSCVFGSQKMQLVMPNGRKYDLSSALTKWWWQGVGATFDFGVYYMAKPSSTMLQLLIPEIHCSLVATIEVTKLFWTAVKTVTLYYDDGRHLVFNPTYGYVDYVYDASSRNKLTFSYSCASPKIIQSITHSDGRSVKFYIYSDASYKYLVYVLSTSSNMTVLNADDVFLARRVFDSNGRLVFSDTLQNVSGITPISSGWGGLTAANQSSYFTVLSRTSYTYSLSSTVTGDYIAIAEPGNGYRKFVFGTSFSQMVSRYHTAVTKTIHGGNGGETDSIIIDTYGNCYQNKPKVSQEYTMVDANASNYSKNTYTYASSHGETAYSASSQEYNSYEGASAYPAIWNTCPLSSSILTSRSMNGVAENLTKCDYSYSHTSNYDYVGIDSEATYSYPAGSSAPDYYSGIRRTYTSAIRGSYYPKIESFYFKDSSTARWTQTYDYDSYGRQIRMQDSRSGSSFHICYAYGRSTSFYLFAPYDSPLTSDIWTAYGTIAGTASQASAVSYLVTYFKYDSVLNPIETLVKDSRSQSAKDLATYYSYDPITNNLTRITYPEGNSVFLDLGGATFSSAYEVTERNTLDTTASSSIWGARHQTDYYTVNMLGKVTSKKSVVYTDYAENAPLSTTLYPIVTRSVTYDNMGRAKSISITPVSPSGSTVLLLSRVYDDANRTVTTTDAKGFITVRTYDAFFRLIDEKNYKPDTDSETASYTGTGKTLISETAKTYDIAYPKNVLTETVFGDTTGTTYYRTIYTYDSLGRLLTVSRGNAATTALLSSTIYDDNTNTVTALSYQNISAYAKTVSVSDWLGRITSTTQYDGTIGAWTAHTTAFTYDYLGNMLTKVLPNGETYVFGYTLSGLLESIVYPDGRGTEALTYDGNGSLLTRTDVGGNHITYTYNSANLEDTRTATATGKSPIAVATTYSQWGPATITQSMGGAADMSIIYGYNCLGLTTGETRTINLSGTSLSASIGHAYDNAGNLMSLSVSGFADAFATPYTKTITYSTPFLGSTLVGSSSQRKTDVKTSTGTILGQVATLFSGAFDQVYYGVSGATTQYANYDFLMRPQTIDNPGISHDQTYTYDYKGNVLTWNGRAYTYDGLDQLATDNGTTTYVHDLIGNTTSAGSNGYSYDPLGTTTTDTMRLVGSSGTVTSTFTNDNLGNLLSATGRYSGLTYDAFNRLIEIKDTARVNGSIMTDAYAYDPFGLRYKKAETLADGSTETTYYLYEGNSILYEETWTSGAMSKANFNIYLGGQNIGRYQYSNGVESLQYFYNDHLGSRRTVTDSFGQVMASIAYSTWGIPTVTNVAAGYDGSDDISYTGKELDATGLYYFNARYYDPQIGRFITEDPARDGLNWYVYCRNNPISFVDVDGRQAIEFPLSLPFELEFSIPTDVFPLAYPSTMSAEGSSDQTPGPQRIDWMDPPSGPSGLGPEWKETTSADNKSGNRDFYNKETGESVRWDTGEKRGQGGHWHRYNPNETGKKDAYLDAKGRPCADGSKPSHIYPKTFIQKVIDGINGILSPSSTPSTSTGTPYQII